MTFGDIFTSTYYQPHCSVAILHKARKSTHPAYTPALKMISQSICMNFNNSDVKNERFVTNMWNRPNMSVVGFHNTERFRKTISHSVKCKPIMHWEIGQLQDITFLSGWNPGCLGSKMQRLTSTTITCTSLIIFRLWHTQVTTKPVGSCTIITRNLTEYRQHILYCLMQMLNLAAWHKKWH